MCEKCRIYLYDYLQQPIDKENPLYPFVNQKQLLKSLPQVVDLLYHLLFNTITVHRFTDAKSQVENYCSFVIKAENPYQQYEMLYTFLNREKKLVQEIKQMEGLLLDLQFLKLQKTDTTCRVLHRWLAFLFGSLYHDMFVLHRQHTHDSMWPINLEKGHPGRPDTAVKKKKPVDKWIVVDVDEEDDLYT